VPRGGSVPSRHSTSVPRVFSMPRARSFALGKASLCRELWIWLSAQSRALGRGCVSGSEGCRLQHDMQGGGGAMTSTTTRLPGWRCGPRSAGGGAAGRRHDVSRQRCSGVSGSQLGGAASWPPSSGEDSSLAGGRPRQEGGRSCVASLQNHPHNGGV
jgi:hypothetical protein